MKKATIKDLEPIKKEERKEWDALIKKTQTVVNAQDRNTWELVLLAGEVENTYGSGRLALWADAAGLSYSQAKQFRWLSNKGVDRDFINKWTRSSKNPRGLSYSVIREVLNLCGNAKSPYAIQYLEWAVEHKATVVSVRAYILELNAPHRKGELGAESVKMALKDKQEHEGFSDFIAQKLGEIIEEYPQAEEKILATVITNSDDLKRLEVAAGILTDEDEALMAEGQRFLRKLKNMRQWLLENERQLSISIATGHLASDEVRDALRYLSGDAGRIAQTPITEFDDSDIPVVEIQV